MHPKKNDSILKNNWSRKDVDLEDDPYEAPILAYNKKWTILWRLIQLIVKWKKKITRHA
jgi:hypothetical protein